MPPKKKGKGSKLARMSEEERLRYMQHRSAIEEEARRRKQQLIALFMKNKLKHEEGFTRLNIAKINQQWRQLLRQIKTQELRTGVETMRQCFEHVLRGKNLVLDEMLKDLTNADDQYSMILRGHTETVDKLIALHGARLGELNSSFLQERDLLVSGRNERRVLITETLDDAADHLKTIIHSGVANQSDADVEFDANRTLVVDEARDVMLGDIDQITNHCESRMEDIWRQFYRVINGYLSDTQSSRSQYSKLRARDIASGQDLHQCYDKADKLARLVAVLKSRLSEQQDGDVVEMRDEKLRLERYFCDVRGRLGRDIKTDEKRLTHLSVHSGDVIKYLTALSNKGVKILQLAAAFSKMETEREKVVPFGLDEDEEVDEEVDLQLSASPAKEIINYTALTMFWRRYNQVFLERAALSLHREALAEDNRQLRVAVKQYLTAMSKHGQADPRPSTTQLRKHVTIIPRDLPSTAGGTPTKRPVTCIEASTCNAVKHMIRYQ